MLVDFNVDFESIVSDELLIGFHFRIIELRVCILAVKVRKSLHSRLGLPLDRPLLRIANAIYLSTVATSKKNLIQKGKLF